MKTITLTASLLLACSMNSQIADWSWARMAWGTYDDQPRNVAVDPDGNVYVTGRFGSDTINFPPMNIPNGGSTNTADFFLARYDAAGNIQWVTTAGGSDDDEGMTLTTDASGNIYVAGYFESPQMVLGTFTLTNNSFSGIADIFVAKFNSSGNVVWAASYGGANQEWPYAIVADPSGNTYLAGIFFSLGPNFGSYSVVHSGQGDAFVVRFDASGNPQWAQQIGGSGNDNLLSASLNNSLNVVVAGEFKSSALGFSPNLVNAGGYDIFVVTYDNNGGALMSKSFGGPGDESAYSVSTDAAGNIYLTGYFQSPTLVMGSTTLTNVTGRDMYLAKLDAAGNVLWAKRNDGNTFSEPRVVKTDAMGSVYLTGNYNFANITFGTTTFTNSSGYDIYLVKFDGLTGNVLWAKTISDQSHEIVFGMTTDLWGSVYLAGTFGYSVTIGSDQLVGSSQGASDIFTAKLCQAPPVPTVIPGVTVCPGVIATVSLNLPGGYLAGWYNAAVNGTLISGGNTFTASASSTVFVALKDTLPGCGFAGLPVPVNFSVHPSASISVTGSTLNANVSALAGFSYHWYDCLYGGLVTEYSNKPFTPISNGSYALIVQIDNCADTSDCFSFNTLDLPARAADRWIVTGSEGRIDISGASGEFTVTDILGRQMQQVRCEEQTPVTVPLPPGIYLVAGKDRAVKVVVR